MVWVGQTEVFITVIYTGMQKDTLYTRDQNRTQWKNEQTLRYNLKTYAIYAFMTNFKASVGRDWSVNSQLDSERHSDITACWRDKTICSLHSMEELTNCTRRREDLCHLCIHGYLGPRL